MAEEQKKLTLEIVTKDGVFVGGTKISEDFLSRIKRPELNLLLGMLGELALTKEQLDKLTPDSDYVKLLPPGLQHSIAILRDAVADPQKLDDIIEAEIASDKRFSLAAIRAAYPALDEGKATQIQQERINEFKAEFTRIVLHKEPVTLAETGLTSAAKSAPHAALKGALNAYGPQVSDEEIEKVYKLGQPKKAGDKPTAGLIGRMRNAGYTFFILRDESGAPVALASGNASKLADAGKTEFRLLNMAVPQVNQGQGYGSQLIEAVREYAQANDYEKIVMPLSMHAIAQENPVRYAGMLKNLDMAAPQMTDHPSDPFSIEFRISPLRARDLWEKTVTPPGASWAVG